MNIMLMQFGKKDLFELASVSTYHVALRVSHQHVLIVNGWCADYFEF
jgi:hypothetical protein